LGVRGRHDGWKWWCLQPAPATGRNESVVVKELCVVDVGLLGKPQGEKIDGASKLGNSSGAGYVGEGVMV
jgi:hypothetical protein